eukprot:5548676-Ditylum_brightwellii.AAC.1
MRWAYPRSGYSSWRLLNRSSRVKPSWILMWPTHLPRAFYGDTHYNHSRTKKSNAKIRPMRI